jgi:hypothetical protein
MRSSRLFSLAREIRETDNDESGVVLVEFVYVIPVLIFLIIAGFEFGNLLHLKQSVAFIAKESALYSYKECSPYHDDTPRAACLEYVRNRMQALATRTIEHAKIDMILGVYRHIPGANPRPISQVPDGTSTTNLGDTSKIRPLFLNDPALRNLLEDRELISTAEVYIHYEPIFVRVLGGIDFATFEFYELSMY